MKASVKTNQPERKLVAVVAVDGDGFYFPYVGNCNKSVYITSDGKVGNPVDKSLEDLVVGDIRKPVYEGDTVTLQF